MTSIVYGEILPKRRMKLKPAVCFVFSRFLSRLSFGSFAFRLGVFPERQRTEITGKQE